MTIVELAKKFDDFTAKVTEFMVRQEIINKRVDWNEVCLRGNGKDGVVQSLAKLDGRIERLEKSDGRRQKIIDSLIVGVALSLILEIIRLYSVYAK
jgi:hypothetical protein